MNYQSNCVKRNVLWLEGEIVWSGLFIILRFCFRIWFLSTIMKFICTEPRCTLNTQITNLPSCVLLKKVMFFFSSGGNFFSWGEIKDINPLHSYFYNCKVAPQKLKQVYKTTKINSKTNYKKKFGFGVQKKIIFYGVDDWGWSSHNLCIKS